MSLQYEYQYPAFPFWIRIKPPVEPDGSWVWSVIADNPDPKQPAPPPLATGFAPTLEAAQERAATNVRLLVTDDVPAVPAEISLRMWGERNEIGKFWLTKWSWLIHYKGSTISSGWAWNYSDARRMALQSLSDLLTKHNPYRRSND